MKPQHKPKPRQRKVAILDNGRSPKTTVILAQPGTTGREVTVIEQGELDLLEPAVSIIPQQQLAILWRRTPAHAIRQRPGPGGKSLSYIPHGYVEGVINKALGGDWDFEIIQDAFDGKPFDLTVIENTPPGGKPVLQRMVTVMGRMTLRIRNPKNLALITTITKVEFGSAAWGQGVEFGDSLKSASSDALKRCGLRLGIGLDLYYDEESEYQAFQERRAKLAELIRVQAEPSTPENLAQLISRASGELGMDGESVCQHLNLPPMTQGGLVQLGSLCKNSEQTTEIWQRLQQSTVINPEASTQQEG